MLRIIFLILIFFFTSTRIFALTVITGRILGSDGLPMQMAQISLHYPENAKIIKTIQAGMNGQYSLNINKPGIWMLHAAGVGFKDKWITLYIEKEKKVQLDICLGGYRYLQNFERAAVIGNFNNWHILNAVPMKILSDGILNAEVQSITDSVSYRLINVRDGDAVEGTQADRYVYDPGKGYISVLAGKKGEKIKITFDTKKLVKTVTESKINFEHPDSTISKFALIIDSLQINQDLAMAALIDYRRTYGSGMQFPFNWDAHISSVENQINAENKIILRQALLISYQTMCMAAKRIDAAVYKKVLDEIPPESIVWELKPHNLFYAVGHSGKTDEQQEKYMEEVINRHPSRSVRIAALFDFYMACKLSDQKEKAAKYFNLLVKRYGNTEEGKTIISRYPIR